MSYKALNHVGFLSSLTPSQKLLLFQLATLHNAKTGQCHASPERLAKLTGMAPDQVRRTMKTKGFLAHASRNENGQWHFPATVPSGEQTSIPLDWWPSDDAIQQLIEAFPSHHFDMEEAVNDFIKFTREQGRPTAANERDAVFVKNISAILSRRRPGAVKISGSSGRRKDASVRSLLSGVSEQP